jgi:uncharacterized protein YpiB (UPF0302 family)
VSDDKDKLAKIELSQIAVERIAKRSEDEDLKLYYRELRKAMRVVHENQLEMDELRSIVDTLSEGHVLQIEEMQQLRKIVAALVKRDEDRAKELGKLADRLTDVAKEISEP